jgi:NADH:ubiquinone oxidoreductase subunit 5 (subunit L)/multisubunit Na+/H+ antiporter MnhA subunit
MGSMIGLVMADNFLQMFLFWEVIGLCSYLLVSFWYKRPEAVRAGVKVFLITRVGDVCLLGAIVLLYASLGSFSFSYTMDHISEVSMPVLSAVAFLILGGAIAKSAQLPPAYLVVQCHGSSYFCECSSARCNTGESWSLLGC